MQRRGLSGGRHIVSNLESALDGVGAMAAAPARHKGAGEGRVTEMHRNRVVEDAAQARRSDGPAVGAAILVEPGLDPVEPGAEPARRHRDPDPYRKSALGLADHQLRT